MQRLRRLKQLATLDLIFPGATHTRFAHSVGVFYITTAILDHLIDMQHANPQLRWPRIDEAQKIATQLAALFHDVGHGPFSHVFEIFCKRYPAYRNYQHENMTELLITEGLGDFSDIPLFLRDTARHAKEIGVPGDLEFLQPENIARISQGSHPYANPQYLFLSQIVSYSIDADRIDYLRRDAYYTGVETGRVDAWEIINNVRIGIQSAPTGGEVYVLQIAREAAPALEAFLAARDLTYRRVYYNKPHRATQELVIRALAEILVTHRPEDIAMKTDEEMITMFSEHNSVTKNVAERLTRRKLYEQLPFNFNVYQDLRERPRERLDELRSAQSTDVFSTEKQLASDLNVKQGETLIIDIEQAPLTQGKDYFRQYIYDSQTGKSISLVDALPHLRLTRGTVTDPARQTQVDLGTVYLDMLSEVSVYAPAELSIEVAAAIKRKVEQFPQPPDESQLRKLIEQETDREASPLKHVFNQLAQLLQFSKTEKESLWTKYSPITSRAIEQIIYRLYESQVRP